MFSTLFLRRKDKNIRSADSRPNSAEPEPVPDSLPELNDGRAGVSQVGAGQVSVAHGGVGEAGVLAVLVLENLNAAWCVPGVVAGGPG